MQENKNDAAELMQLTADIVASHVSNNTVAVSDLPVLIPAANALIDALQRRIEHH